MKIRKQVYELTREDFDRFPVWEFALDEEGVEEQDEATVRPYELAGALEPSDGMFVVKAMFTLADGTRMEGYLTPPVQGEDGLGTLQPIIITESAQVAFWCGGFVPSPEELAQWYQMLGREAGKVFPVLFESEVEIAGGPGRGTIPGFVIRDSKTDKTRVIT